METIDRLSALPRPANKVGKRRRHVDVEEVEDSPLTRPTTSAPPLAPVPAPAPAVPASASAVSAPAPVVSAPAPAPAPAVSTLNEGEVETQDESQTNIPTNPLDTPGPTKAAKKATKMSDGK